MKKPICLTGIKPTGMPHLGNYLGAIKPAISMAATGKYDCFYFIADYHSLTTIHDAKLMREYVYEVAATWLSMGLNPDQVTIYRQSDIPEIMEMNWILSCFTAKGHMNRAHAYKAIAAENTQNGRDVDQGINMGIYGYPVLMASDILFLQTNFVPVGADQLQHIEIAREIVSSFNAIYGEVLTPPEAMVQSETLVPGLDGRKMSKSYQNTIPLFLPEKKLQKLINKIKTDSLPPEAPKDPSDSLIFDLFKFFSTKAQQDDLAAWYKKGIGWGEAKAELFKVINVALTEPRAKYEELMANPALIDNILDEGAAKVRPKAAEFLKSVKVATGMSR
ncbi:MAG: tryptophan--tRNA ligase [Bdellovibrionales bacterium CG12_big_fil_rev_8_21_14_0_65_38_15]|nr:MAG: tryptophan--tRNA ligase [Bdellovibrionales bacterium CG22_combo_CG10-13_8_21_14_all_38_13]PIQ55793.1 MAG: tryptophan--tRNA ligase [Bdellovibrionales bacterium CG12_big_fil_rev_8_21_14_0_65_38_15]PIR28373.1 MAG: tryptophan--tRNA ligase [Bdellovibrionales bacterium CG11_big_fil_rev_8_21_14_0_20_38_13]